jgi:hypothetical protein
MNIQHLIRRPTRQQKEYIWILNNVKCDVCDTNDTKRCLIEEAKYGIRLEFEITLRLFCYKKHDSATFTPFNSLLSHALPKRFVINQRETRDPEARLNDVDACSGERR